MCTVSVSVFASLLKLVSMTEVFPSLRTIEYVRINQQRQTRSTTTLHQAGESYDNTHYFLKDNKHTFSLFRREAVIF